MWRVYPWKSTYVDSHYLRVGRRGSLLSNGAVNRALPCVVSTPVLSCVIEVAAQAARAGSWWRVQVCLSGKCGTRELGAKSLLVELRREPGQTSPGSVGSLDTAGVLRGLMSILPRA